jgi:hypothetical protein
VALMLDPDLLQKAVTITADDAVAARTPVDEDRLLAGFVAEFVAESESLDGHDTNAADVLNSVRDLVLE